MSHAKETPRQKMIGMMYLVLTCLLALNVSKEVLEGFVTINDSIESTNKNFETNTRLMMESLEEAISKGRNEVRPYYEKSKETVKLSDAVFNYVDVLKKEVKKYTEDVPGADTMRLSSIEKLDDFDKPTFLLIGSDETRPKTGEFSANELRLKMTQYSAVLNKMIDEMKNKPGSKLPEKDYLVLKDKLKIFTPTDSFKDREGNPLSWEFKNFYHMPLAAVVTNLSKIQNDIKSIEAGMVSTFAAASGKLTLPINEYAARIVPVSQYIQSGSAYTADVFLTASSSHFTEDNIQFILGEVDTATGRLISDAKILPVHKGRGKISFPVSGAGHRDVKGWIRLKNENGIDKYFRYENEFIVANAAVAVSPEKMNVFYIGVDNPVNVSAAGVAPTDLVVNIKGCGGNLLNTGNGKFIVKVNTTGSCTVTVLAKTPDGLKQQGSPQIFRVKSLPNPPMKIGGKSTFGLLELPASQARTINAIGLDNSGFDFNAPCKVIEFSISIVSQGGVSPDYKCTGNQLSPAALQAISKLKAGNKIYFENITVQVAGEVRGFPPSKIVVK
jgi:gliding motility-associated protein GldM